VFYHFVDVYAAVCPVTEVEIFGSSPRDNLLLLCLNSSGGIAIFVGFSHFPFACFIMVACHVEQTSWFWIYYCV